MKKRVVLISVIAILIIAVAAAFVVPYVMQYKYRYMEIDGIGVISLVADPEKYHKEEVRVFGLLSATDEKCVLYCTAEDYLNNITINAVLVDCASETYAELKKYDRCFVYLNGIFNKKLNDDEKMYSGKLQGNITKISNVCKLDDYLKRVIEQGIYSEFIEDTTK